ncbi:partial [Paramuricea clavata]|uniref:Partial n=1 Tax=Paramuricea clavata TaxID=317549 RepID=A0A6S7HEQ8_PARCT|nr:partial [Paramuricea clavata]
MVAAERNELERENQDDKTIRRTKIDIINASKEENVDELVTQGIEESDNAIAELERVLLELDDEFSICQSVKSFELSSKLELRKFSGKICEWQEFWDGFSSSIDNNEQLYDVDKFAYLRGLLEEPAKSTIAGFSLTEANYKSAVELLKKRFDKKSAVQRAHVNRA